MKNNLFIKPLLLFLLLGGIIESGYAQLTIGGTVRPRSEFRNGFKTLKRPNNDPAFFTEQRTRVDMGYKADKFKIGIAFQDVRIWGSTAQISKTDGLTSFYQAWGEILFTDKLSVKMGRQELVYDDERILGSLDWAAQGRNHDAIKLVYADSSWSLHAGAAYNQDNNTAEGKKLFNGYYDATIANYKAMQYLWFGKELNKFKFSLLALNNGLQSADSSLNYTQTYGTNMSFKPSKLGFNGTAYYQAGKDKTKKTVDAYLFSLSATYDITDKTMVSLGADYVSGTGATQTANHSFDPLYGTHHKFYGYMDYFYVGNASAQAGKTIGLTDIFLKSKFKLGKNLVTMLDVHQFSSPVTINDPANAGQTLSSSLGTEIDFTLNYTLAQGLSIVGGYSQMFATTTMEAIKGGDKDKFTNWTYLMVVFKPTLLK